MEHKIQAYWNGRWKYEFTYSRWNDWSFVNGNGCTTYTGNIKFVRKEHNVKIDIRYKRKAFNYNNNMAWISRWAFIGGVRLLMCVCFKCQLHRKHAIFTERDECDKKRFRKWNPISAVWRKRKIFAWGKSNDCRFAFRCQLQRLDGRWGKLNECTSTGRCQQHKIIANIRSNSLSVKIEKEVRAKKKRKRKFDVFYIRCSMID